MAINASILRRPSDSNLLLAIAVAFPLIVLAGYYKTYYLKPFFDSPDIANSLVHFHALVMSTWVIYFVVQVALIRTKNIRLHMTMGIAGVGLAALVIVVGMATAYDSQLVRRASPPGTDPHEFFVLPAMDMLLFAILFASAIYYRKRPAEHKSLMLLTAINFMPAAIFRMPITDPEHMLLPAFLIPMGIAIAGLIWQSWTYKRINKVFALGIFMLAISLPLRTMLSQTAAWHAFTNWLAG